VVVAKVGGQISVGVDQRRLDMGDKRLQVHCLDRSVSDEKLSKRLPPKWSGEVRNGATPHGFGHSGVPEVIGQHDDGQVRGYLTHLPHRVEPIAIVEIESEQDEVRVVLLELFDRFRQTRRLQRLIAERLDEAGGRLAIRRVAVDDQNRAGYDHLWLTPQPTPDLFAHICNGSHALRTIPRGYALWI
jgi:hypothetical protein